MFDDVTLPRPAHYRHAPLRPRARRARTTKALVRTAQQKRATDTLMGGPSLVGRKHGSRLCAVA